MGKTCTFIPAVRLYPTLVFADKCFNIKLSNTSFNGHPFYVLALFNVDTQADKYDNAYRH